MERDRPTVTEVTRRIDARLDGTPLVVMLDIDGTLAPIAPRPDEAAIPGATRDALDRLSLVPDVSVALVTGRSARDGARMAAGAHVWIVGNHGLEVQTPDGEVVANPAALAHRDAISRAASELAPVARAIDGAIVENKDWTMSVHYRLVAADAVPRLIDRARAVASSHGLRVTEGKKIVELRPPVTVDKGTAAVALAERLGALLPAASVFFAGDDRTDEDAFRALRARSAHAVTVRVGLADGDATEAEFLLESPDDVRAVLEWLVARRERPASGQRS